MDQSLLSNLYPPLFNKQHNTILSLHSQEKSYPQTLDGRNSPNDERSRHLIILIDKTSFMVYNVLESEVIMKKVKKCLTCMLPSKLKDVKLNDKYGVRVVKVCNTCTSKYFGGK